jgi:hypothetical protein
VWELIQQARFDPNACAALQRLPRRRYDLNQRDVELYGLLKL